MVRRLQETSWKKRCSQTLNTGGSSLGICGVHGPGREGKWARRLGGGGCQLGDPPLNELLHHLHPRIELVQGKDVLLSKQPQSRALPKVLQREQRVGVGTHLQRRPGDWRWDSLCPEPLVWKTTGRHQPSPLSRKHTHFHFKILAP